jgi:hypothetical protein
MANAWAFSALSAGPAFIAKFLAMALKASASLRETVAGTATRLIISVIDGIGGLRSTKRRNQFPGSTKITLQPNKKRRRCAIAHLGFTLSWILGAIGSLQPAA